MSIPSDSAVEEGEGQEREEHERNHEEAHHPTAPFDELFDISTTVDPSYIISLIRKLVPVDGKTGNKSPEVGKTSNKSPEVDACDASTEGSKSDGREHSAVLLSQNGVVDNHDNGIEAMDAVELSGHDGRDCDSDKKMSGLMGEDVWEEYGCIVWDLAANKTHAEFLVQNLVLEVLLANLMVPQSVRITEIILGILGNLGCHEASCRQIPATSGLIEVIVDQLFLDDTPCLCEAFWVLTLGLQSSECVTWAEALRSENILSRILWVAENALNPQLIEKSVGLLLAIFESEQVVVAGMLPSLVHLGLPDLLINLLTFEMSKFAGERAPERYCVLDIILRAIEALSVIDDYSQEVTSNRELFRLLVDLVKMPDKSEVANCCVTAAILIANILTDAADMASDISQDLSLLQVLFDIFSFASDDMEAKSALWSIINRLLIQLKESQMNLSTPYQHVSVFVSKSELIEDELLDHQLGSCNAGGKLGSKAAAVREIIGMLSQWIALKDSNKESNFMVDNHLDDGTVDRLLECCHKYVLQVEQTDGVSS